MLDSVLGILVIKKQDAIGHGITFLETARLGFKSSDYNLMQGRYLKPIQWGHPEDKVGHSLQGNWAGDFGQVTSSH